MLKWINKKLQRRSDDPPGTVTKYLNILFENKISFFVNKYTSDAIYFL